MADDKKQKKDSPKKDAKPKKRLGSFWKSKAAIRAYLVFGIPVVALLLWYFYTVTYELNKPAMVGFEAKIAEKVKKLAEKKVKLEYYDACENMIKEYTTPKGWNYSNAALNELLGLKKSATEQELTDRCIYYAKTVIEMEKMSHHLRHVFVCKDSFFYLGEDSKQYIKADPNGQGALASFVEGKEEMIPIPAGESSIFKFWQIHNVGDGCIIVGLSKSGTFRMAGHIVRSKEGEAKSEDAQQPKDAEPAGK